MGITEDLKINHTFESGKTFASLTMVAWLKTSDEMTTIIKAFFYICTATQTNQFNPHNNSCGQAGQGLLFSLTEEKTECGRGSNYPESPKVMMGTQLFPGSL